MLIIRSPFITCFLEDNSKVGQTVQTQINLTLKKIIRFFKIPYVRCTLMWIPSPTQKLSQDWQPPWGRARRPWQRRQRRRLRRTTQLTLDWISGRIRSQTQTHKSHGSHGKNLDSGWRTGSTDIASVVNQVRFHVLLLCLYRGNLQCFYLNQELFAWFWTFKVSSPELQALERQMA